jgi:hypothetical protein
MVLAVDMARSFADQLRLVHLAHGQQGKRGAGDELPGHLVPRQQRLAVLAQARRRQRLRLALQEGGADLAPHGVGCRHHGAQLHAGYRLDDGLHLTRTDAVAAGLEHLVGAAAQLQVALNVQAAEVSRAQPAIGVSARALASARFR